MYTNTRVGGQRERQHQSFEAGAAYFPRDFPSSIAYLAHAHHQEIMEYDRWSRKPPAKRPNWTKLGTPSPFMPDWRRVLDLPPYSRDETDLAEDRDPWKFETIKCLCGCDKRHPLQRELFQASEVSEQPEASEDSKIRTWLLRAQIRAPSSKNASMLLSPAAAVLDEINKLRLTHNMTPLGNEVKRREIVQGCAWLVRVTPVGRGSPDDLAMIIPVG